MSVTPQKRTHTNPVEEKVSPVISQDLLRDEYLKKPIKGIFKYLELPGGRLKFDFKLPIKGETVKPYDLLDGDTIEIPLGLAVHLNRECSYDIEENTFDSHGRLTSSVQKRVNRAQFSPIGFMDMDTMDKYMKSLAPGRSF